MTVWQEAVVLFVGVSAVAQLDLDHIADSSGPSQPPRLVAAAGGHRERDVTVLVSGRKLARQVQPYRIDRVRECDQLVPFRHHDLRRGGAPYRLAAANVFFDHRVSRTCKGNGYGHRAQTANRTNRAASWAAAIVSHS
jgi:hypothetical protein